MSQKAFDEFEKVRDDMLRQQRKCNWCGHIAETSDGLVRHILENSGDDQHDREPLKTVERELLAKLQQEDAK